MQLQEHAARIADGQALVVGLSYDPVPVLGRFAEAHGVSFPLLSDEGSATIRALGLENHHIAEHQAYYGKPVDERHAGLPYPGTFLLDEAGVVVDKQFEQSYRWRPSAPVLLADLTRSAANAAVAGQDAGPALHAAAWVETDSYRPQEISRVQVRLRVEPGQHVYVEPIPAGYTALRIALSPVDGMVTNPAALPEGRPWRLPGTDEEFRVVDGAIEAAIPFRIEADQGDVVLRVEVDYQACDDHSCLVPGRLAVDLPITAQAQSGEPVAARKEVLEVAGREVTISNPDKVFFPRTGHTKLDLVHYYLAVAEGALRGVAGRPMALKRFVHGAEGEFFFQKRAPQNRPDWIETVTLHFPSGRSADEIVVRDAAQLAWVVNLGCIDLNPHPVRADDLDHPDELRIDLDPVPGVEWPQILEVAKVTAAALDDFGLRGWPKTSGSRGFHIYCRIQRRWTFDEVRRAAVALAREVERRAPGLATSRWWKEERHGVFLDYNQNAKDRTVASAYSVRPTPDARVSTPLRRDEVAFCRPEAFTLSTVPARVAEMGDPSAGIDESPGSLEPLLELALRHEAAGMADAPWPPHYEKQAGEPPRVQPSRRSTGKSTVRRGTVPPPAPGKTSGPTGRRRTSMPLIEIARAATQAEALRGLDRWKQRHPQVWPLLGPADVLVDSMRGRSSTWTRVRLNLRNVPEAQRPPQEALEVDYDPWEGVAAPVDPPVDPPEDPPGEAASPGSA